MLTMTNKIRTTIKTVIKIYETGVQLLRKHVPVNYSSIVTYANKRIGTDVCFYLMHHGTLT